MIERLITTTSDSRSRDNADAMGDLTDRETSSAHVGASAIYGSVCLTMIVDAPDSGRGSFRYPRYVNAEDPPEKRCRDEHAYFVDARQSRT